MLRFTAIVQSLKSIGGETLGMSLLDGHKLPVTDIFPIDASYYFQDVYFLVEDTCFKLPRRAFENDSETLRLALANYDGGGTADKPFPLLGIKANEFIPFLKIMFPDHYGVLPELDTFQWGSVLKLSTKWRIEKIRTTAIDNLRTISFDDPIFAIILARDYNVDQWLQPAFHKLAKRQKSLSPPEIRALGDEYVAKICKIRDRAIDLIALRGDVYDWGNNLLITPKRYNVDFTSVIEYELKH